jgi:hypothetical protein
MTDGKNVRYHGWGDTPSVLLKLIRSRCVPIGVKRLKVLTTCREFWVSGKPSSQSAWGVDIPPTTRLASSSYLCSTSGNTCCKGNQEYGFCSRTTDVRPALWKCVWSCSRLWWTCPWVGMKGKRLLRNDPLVFQACELGLPCKVWNSIQNRPFLAEIETAWSLCHIE